MVCELEQMDVVEYRWWQLHFKKKADAEKKAMDSAKGKRGRRR